MASSAADLTSIVLIFRVVAGLHNMLELAENSRYIFHPPSNKETWKGNLPESPSPPLFSLRFGEHIYSPHGWVFGSSDDSDLCDIQLAENNTTGISRRHLQIDISPATYCPRLTVLSRNSLRVFNDGHALTLDQGQNLDIASKLTIDLGEVILIAWRPKLSTHEERLYRKNAEKFSREFLDARPVPLNRRVLPSTTLDLRFGENDKVYKLEESRSSGSSASVVKVRELHSRDVFAAKIPHFKSKELASTIRNRSEVLYEEYEKLKYLKHVSQALIHKYLP